MKKKDRERAIEIEKRDELRKKRIEEGKDFIYCPLCKEYDHEANFLANHMIRSFIHLKCGVVFMNPKHVKQLLDEVRKQKSNRIFTPADTKTPIIIPGRNG